MNQPRGNSGLIFEGLIMKSYAIYNIWNENSANFEEEVFKQLLKETDLDSLFASYYGFLTSDSVRSLRARYRAYVAFHPTLMEEYEGVVGMIGDYLATKEWFDEIGVAL